VKPWLICVAALVAGNAYSQIYTVPSNTARAAVKYTPSMLKAKDLEPKGYFSFATTAGVYPLIGITSDPVARFQYQYATTGNVVNYADSVRSYRGSSKSAITVGFEFGKKKGVFFNTAAGAFVGMTSSRVTTFYFSNSMGYNIQTGIPGLVLQPSIGWSMASVRTQFAGIQQNKSDIWVFNETMNYHSPCGCNSKAVYVKAINTANFVQAKLALKYNLNRVVGISVGATYYVPLRNSFHIELENKSDYVRRSGYVSPSVAATHDDDKRNAATPIYAEATLTFNMMTSSRKRHRSNHYRSGYHSHFSAISLGGGCH
jgi:hypothetical protein